MQMPKIFSDLTFSTSLLSQGPYHHGQCGKLNNIPTLSELARKNSTINRSSMSQSLGRLMIGFDPSLQFPADIPSGKLLHSYGLSHHVFLSWENSHHFDWAIYTIANCSITRGYQSSSLTIINHQPEGISKTQ